MHDSVQGPFVPKVDEAAAARQSPSHLNADTGLLGMRMLWDERMNRPVALLVYRQATQL